MSGGSVLSRIVAGPLARASDVVAPREGDGAPAHAPLLPQGRAPAAARSTGGAALDEDDAGAPRAQPPSREERLDAEPRFAAPRSAELALVARTAPEAPLPARGAPPVSQRAAQRLEAYAPPPARGEPSAPPVRVAPAPTAGHLGERRARFEAPPLAARERPVEQVEEGTLARAPLARAPLVAAPLPDLRRDIPVRLATAPLVVVAARATERAGPPPPASRRFEAPPRPRLAREPHAERAPGAAPRRAPAYPGGSATSAALPPPPAPAAPQAPSPRSATLADRAEVLPRQDVARDRPAPEEVDGSTQPALPAGEGARSRSRLLAPAPRAPAPERSPLPPSAPRGADATAASVDVKGAPRKPADAAAPEALAPATQRRTAQLLGSERASPAQGARPRGAGRPTVAISIGTLEIRARPAPTAQPLAAVAPRPHEIDPALPFGGRALRRW